MRNRCETDASSMGLKTTHNGVAVIVSLMKKTLIFHEMYILLLFFDKVKKMESNEICIDEPLFFA